MIDREKVISGLKYCLDRSKEKVHCGDCPYWLDDFESGCHIYDMMRDALALLKKREARVMTKNEVECDCPDCVYFETRTGWLECAIKDDGESDCYFGVFVYGCNEWFMRSYEEYGKTWRCWTARPSEHQMRETKWEGEKDAD